MSKTTLPHTRPACARRNRAARLPFGPAHNQVSYQFTSNRVANTLMQNGGKVQVAFDFKLTQYDPAGGYALKVDSRSLGNPGFMAPCIRKEEP